MSLLTLELIRKGSDNSSLIFFPGGPGMSWHYFERIINNLDTTSSIYGINYGPVIGEESTYFDEMRFDLILLLNRLPNPALVTHSFSSMLVLTIPRIPSLKGLILISPAIDNNYLVNMPERLKEYTDFDGTKIASYFWINPSDEAYKDYFKAFLPFYFRPAHLEKGLAMVTRCTFAYLPYGLCVQNFFPSFTTSYPPTMPTLVIAGDDDYICPPTLFKDSETLKKDNIETKIIANAGHFPWVDHEQETLEAFAAWYNHLQTNHAPL